MSTLPTDTDDIAYLQAAVTYLEARLTAAGQEIRRLERALDDKYAAGRS